jgi:hypothetical protein
VADRVEILVDEICLPNCPKRLEHYRDEAKRQLEFEIAAPYGCPNKQERKSFSDCMNKPAFITKEQMKDYIDMGFRNFKLVGRGLPQDLVLDSYLYFLVKDGEEEFIRTQINKRLAEINAKKMAARRR